MSDSSETETVEASEVEVAYGDNPQDLAVLYLAAAEDLGLDPGVVRTTGDGFVVPAEVEKKANTAAFKKKHAKASDSSEANEGKDD